MRILTTFRGRNKDFQAWLTAGMPSNVVFLETYRNGQKKKTVSKKTATRKKTTTITTSSIPDGVA